MDVLIVLRLIVVGLIIVGPIIVGLIVVGMVRRHCRQLTVSWRGQPPRLH